MIRWSELTVKATGQRIRYEYRDAWDKRTYSFDGGQSWYASKVQAYRDAEQKQTLVGCRSKAKGAATCKSIRTA
jgi:hypothetical protein